MAVSGVSGNSLFYREVGLNYPVKWVKLSSVPLSQLLPRSPLCCCSSLSFKALSTETPPDGYRRNVAICLVNSSKKGSAAEGEELRNAAMRELREETGVTSVEFLAETPYCLTYDFPLKVKHKLNRRGEQIIKVKRRSGKNKFSPGSDHMHHNLKFGGSSRTDCSSIVYYAQLSVCIVAALISSSLISEFNG